MSYESKIKDLESLVTKLIKDTIKSKGLVKTGRLLNSISTVAKIKSDGSFSLQVSGENYYDELDFKYNITDDAIENNSEQITNLIEDIYVSYFDEQLNKIK